MRFKSCEGWGEENKREEGNTDKKERLKLKKGLQ